MTQARHPTPTQPICLCRHDIPGQSPHVDLFIGPVGPFDEEARVVRSWRLPASPMDLARNETMPAEETGFHRGLYAVLSEPVVPSNGVGVVSPLLQGHAEVRDSGDGTLAVRVAWQDGSACQLAFSGRQLRRTDGD